MCIIIIESCMLYCMHIQCSSCIHAQSGLNTAWWRPPSYCISNVAGSQTVAAIIHDAQLVLAAAVLSGNAAWTAADDWHSFRITSEIM